MSAWVLIPGNGGAYTSEAMSSTAVGADTLDVSRCTGIELQQILVGASSLAGTFKLQETVDGTNYADFGSAIAVSDAAITKFEAGNRPMHRIRINPALVTGLDSTHTLQVKIVGQAIGSGLT